MRQWLVIADDRADAARRTASRSDESLLDRLIARAKKHKLRTCSFDSRNRIEQHVHALLIRQAAHDSEHAYPRLEVKIEARLQRLLVRPALREMLGIEARNEPRVGGRVPHGLVDAVQYRCEDACPVAE